MNENILLAFTLTAVAGLSTGIGSALAFFTKRTNRAFLSAALGFSAGVMIYVSFVEIFTKAKDALVEVHGDLVGVWAAVGAFFGGILIIGLIDRVIPSYENPHEARAIEEMQQSLAEDVRLMRMGVFTALAIGIHNFPEGLATFFGALSDPAIGIACHNIRHRHSQHPGGDFRIGTHLLCYGQQKQSLLALIPFRGLRTPWSAHRLYHPQALLLRNSIRPPVRRGRRYHGVYFPGSAPAHGQGIRGRAHGDLRVDRRHGCDGVQPAPILVAEPRLERSGIDHCHQGCIVHCEAYHLGYPEMKEVPISQHL